MKLIGSTSLFAVVAAALVSACSSADERLDETESVANVSEKLTAPDSEYVLTPGGFRLHESCIHSVPDGAHIDPAAGVVRLNGAVIKTVAKCRYDAKRALPDASENVEPLPSGPYQEYSGADACTNCGCYISRLTGHSVPCQPWFNKLESRLVVPTDPPTNNGQTVFLWSGLTRQTGSIIMQPVLQWGPSAAGGGGSWTFANWYIDASTGTAFVQHDSLIGLNAGDTYAGSTEVDTTQSCPLNGSGCSWRVISYRYVGGTLTTATAITVASNAFIWNSAYRAVLEAYNLTGCSDLPPGHAAAFTNVQAYQPSTSSTTFKPLNETWLSVVTSPTPGPACSYSVNNVSQTAVTLNY